MTISRPMKQDKTCRERPLLSNRRMNHIISRMKIKKMEVLLGNKQRIYSAFSKDLKRPTSDILSPIQVPNDKLIAITQKNNSGKTMKIYAKTIDL